MVDDKLWEEDLFCVLAHMRTDGAFLAPSVRQKCINLNLRKLWIFPVVRVRVTEEK